jgi:hypothetical protein
MMAAWRNLTVLAGILSLSTFNAWLFTPRKWISPETAFPFRKQQQHRDVPLPLNPNSSMYTDIVGIYHDPQSSSIRVIVQGNWTAPDNNTVPSRKPCLRPYLTGRLSGPTIGMVSQWVYLPKSDNSTVIEGQYKVPMVGMYFLEIIVILCNTYDEEKLRQARNVTKAGDWNLDASMQGEMQHIVEHCVENPENHRLTAQNLSIEVTQPTTVRNAVVSDSSHSTLRQAREGSPPISLGGYWEWNASNNQTVEPLYTRYQPLSCIGVADCQSPPATLDRFSPYRFVWTSNFNLTERLHAGEGIDQDIVPRHFVDEDILRNLIRLRSLTRVNDTICIIGDSHGRELSEFLKPLLDAPVFHVWTSFANELGENVTAESGSLSNSSVEDQVNRYLLVRGGLLPGQCAVFFVVMGSWVRTRMCVKRTLALPVLTNSVVSVAGCCIPPSLAHSSVILRAQHAPDGEKFADGSTRSQDLSFEHKSHGVGRV